VSACRVRRSSACASPDRSWRVWFAERSSTRGSRLAQADPAPTAVAAHVFADQFDARRLQRRDDLHQTIDNAAHIALARLHSLDRGERNIREPGQFALVDAE